MKTRVTNVETNEDNDDDDIANNPLILKLKQQTEDNRETNEALVKQRTAMNDQVSKEV